MDNKVVLVVLVSAGGILAISIVIILVANFLVKVDFLQPEDSHYRPCPSWPRSEEEEEELIVRVQQGLLKGHRTKSAAGGSFISFRGIPYAEAPLGPLRFKDAAPPQSWEGVRNAIHEGTICPQPHDGEIIGDEDCLFLNVYTPSLSPSKPLPVMIWIHGGSFECGSGSTHNFGPDYLIANGVILVTLNYRLGPLGFLFLNESVPGNAGMKDQVAALRWVQQNIEVFGGNSSSVTIFGQSAGAAAVHLHTLSPLTRGLFQRAILQSGCAISKVFTQSSPVETANRLAKEVGCLSENASETVKCLREVEVAKLLEAAPKSRIDKDKKRLLGGIFVPSVDIPVPEVEQFLPKPALQMVMSGHHHDIPILMGQTAMEGIYLLDNNHVLDEDVQKNVDSHWKEIITPELLFPIQEKKSGEAMNEIRNFYMNGKNLTNSTLMEFLNMMNDLHLGFPLNQITKFRKTVEPTYQYMFSVYDELNLKEDLPFDFQGAGHGDDLEYIFRRGHHSDVPENSTAALMRRRMTRLWTNFAKYGKPIPHRDQLLNVYWNPYTESRHTILDIGSILREGINYKAQENKFWETFYETYKPIAGDVVSFVPHAKHV